MLRARRRRDAMTSNVWDVLAWIVVAFSLFVTG
jgi:hypothetical protein